MVRLPFGMTLAGCLIVSVSMEARAQEKAGEKPAEKAPPRQVLEQPGDDATVPFEPIRPLTVEGQKLVDARARFMTGELYLQREQYKKALAEFEKASALDPSNAQIYRSIMETALHLGDTARVVESARKAVELAPDDYDLLRQLALEMAKENKAAEAIAYLEKARNSPKLDKKSSYFVLINRDLGAIYKAIGEFEKAADCFEIVLAALLKPTDFGLDLQARQELQKNRASSYEELGLTFLRAKRIDKAAQALELALKERKGKASAINFLLAQAYFEQGDAQKALTQLDLFLSTQLRRGKAPYQLLGGILEKLGQSATLLDRLEKLAEQDPRNRDVQFFLAEAYAAKDQFDKAEAIYRKSLEDTVSTEAHLGLARIYRKQNKPKELLENLARAFERSNNDQEAVGQIFEVELKAISEDGKLLDALIAVLREQTKDSTRKEHFASAFVLASIASSNEKTAEALELYDIALKANPSSAARVFMAKAEVLIQAKRYAEAADVYQQALANPLAQGGRPDIYYRMSRVLAFAGKTKEALEAVDQLGQLVQPNLPLVLFQRAWIHYYAHNWDDARKGFEDLIAKHPDDGTFTHRARVSLSNVYVQLGDMKKGEEILEQFLVENPDDPGVNNDLGYLYAEQGKNLERAKTMIEKAVKAEPKNGAYLDSMGWVLFKLGQHAEAKTWLEKATQAEGSGGGDSTIWDHLGDAQLQLKDIPGARASWERALKSSKADPKPDEKLNKKIEEKLQLHK